MTVRELIIGIKYNTDEKSIDKANSKLANFKKGMIGLAAGIVTGLAAIGGAALNSAGQMEMLKSDFTTMLQGNQEAADKLVETIQKIGAKTPFETMDLAKNIKTMMAFNISSEDAIKNIQMLGDIAQGDAQKLESLTLAFSQMSSAGKLSGQDLMQMINAGFNPLNQMAGGSVEKYKALRKEMEKGNITFDMVAKAMQDATSAGGQFFGSMDRASKTFFGVLSTFKDNVTNMLTTVGTALIPIIVQGMDKVTTFLDQLMPLIQGLITQLAPVFNMMLDLITQLLPQIIPIIMPILTAILGFLPPIMKIVMLLLPLLMALITPLLPLIQDLAGIITEILYILVPIVDLLVTILVPIIKMIITPIIMVLQPALKFILWLLTLMRPILEFFLKIFTAVAKILGDISNLINDKIMGAFQNVLKVIEDGFYGFINWLIDSINWILTALNKITKINIPLIEKTTKTTSLNAQKDALAAQQKAADNMNRIINNNMDIKVNGENGHKIGKDIASAFQFELQKIIINTRF